VERKAVLRALAEFVAIFSGVLLGLLADDWRQLRQEDADAEEALQLILEDLTNDSIELASLRPPLARHVSWTSWLQEHWTREVPAMDSVGLAFRAYGFANSPQLRASAFSSLKDGDRLGLIRDGGLRAQIVEYYEDSHVRLGQYFESHDEAQGRLFETLFPYILLLPGREPGSVWPAVRAPTTITSPWADLRADNNVYNRATHFGVTAQLAVRFIDEAQVRNADLRAAIKRRLDR
jgi:hypothetical protein